MGSVGSYCLRLLCHLCSRCFFLKNTSSDFPVQDLCFGHSVLPEAWFSSMLQPFCPASGSPSCKGEMAAQAGSVVGAGSARAADPSLALAVVFSST